MESNLLSSLFDDVESTPLSVTELTVRIKAELERRFSDVWVEGEIVNFASVGSGHWYFTLHDASNQIRAACFRGSNWRIRFQPFDGLQVRVRGKISLYEPRGEYQLCVESLEPVGEGALRVAFEQMKAKLEAEGLFADELKRPLPAFPRTVGVVTSPTGAAFFDILHVLARRARGIRIVLIPARVQGETAGEEVRQAILAANRFNRSVTSAERIDVLIVGRGGGSSEDLWSFNEERLARAIRSSEIPVISAVGHEVDFTIADLVADVRAATPSAAAELVAAREEDIHAMLEGSVRSLTIVIANKVLALRNALQTLAMSPVFTGFPNRIERLKCHVDDHMDLIRLASTNMIVGTSGRLDRCVRRLSPLALTARVGKTSNGLALLDQRHRTAGQNVVRVREQQLNRLMAKLDTLSPLSVLQRGFSITETYDGRVLLDAGTVDTGDKLKIRLANGKLEAEVLSSE